MPSPARRPTAALWLHVLGDPARPAVAPTPTRNANLPFRRGGFASLCEALDYAAQGETGLNFFDARGRLMSSLPYRDLRDAPGLRPSPDRRRHEARRAPGADRRHLAGLLHRLLRRAVCRRRARAGRHAGRARRQASYIEQLRRQITAADARRCWLPTSSTNSPTAGRGRQRPARRHDGGVQRPAGDDGHLRPFGAASAATSSSRRAARASRAASTSARTSSWRTSTARWRARRSTAADSAVSWLPLYHDMGLIGFVLAPMCAQRSVDLLAPCDFARRPLQWLSLISRRRATITYGPSFGYELVARRAQTRCRANRSVVPETGRHRRRHDPAAVLHRFAEASRRRASTRALSCRATAWPRSASA